VIELLGYGGTGEVWLARERVTDELVALKRLRPGAEPGARERMRHEAGLLASVHHPHLLRLRAVLELVDDVVLVLDHAGGGSLERLLGARGSLSPGEVVTVLTPLAEALEELHRQGVVHGDVAPANVVIDRSGRPLLADLGIARVLGTPPDAVQGRMAYLDPAVLAGAAPAPSSDVYALAAIGSAALGGVGPDESRHGQALRHVLARILAAEAFLRPTAGELATAVYAACPPTPLEFSGGLTGGSSAGEQPTHRVRPAVPAPTEPPPARTREPSPWWTGTAAGGDRVGRWHRGPLLAVLAACSALALAALGGITWAGLERAGNGPVRAGPAPAGAGHSVAGQGHAGPAGGTPNAEATEPAEPGGTASATPPEPRWDTVLADLDATRARAFLRGDAVLLSSAYAPGSPAGDRDATSLAALADDAGSVEGLSLTPTTVTPLEVGADQVVLRVIDTMAPHVLVQPGTGTRETRPGRGERTWTVVLHRAGAAWQIWDILAGDTWPSAEP
jgi:hypothetical protein